MTKDHAHEVLNQARAGRNVSKRHIRRALTVTGDLAVYADTKRAFEACHGDLDDEEDPLPIRRIRRPVGTWEGMAA